ncbi:MAG TPA: hypothetical protein VN778_02415 [Verrucomicrobiae bacterium]|nr:hypothetical protein [Verrucomicrobiae bacterium]
MKKSLSQKGFTLVEGLLIIIALVLVVFVGYYVWHNQKSTNKTVNMTSQNAHKTEQSKTSASQNLFKLTNVGVQFELPSSLSDFQYTPQTYSDGSVGGYISTAAIENTIKQCIAGQGDQAQQADAESLAFAGLGKLEGQYDPNQVEEGQLLKQFSSFYLTISYPNGSSPCYSDQNAMDQLQSQEHAASDAFTKVFQSSATEIK